MMLNDNDNKEDFLNLTSFEIERSNNKDYEPICISLLLGENFITFDSLNCGCRLSVTNYRIIIIFDFVKDGITKSNIISIPLGLIYHLEQYGFVCLNIITKVGRKFNVTFPNIELCEEVIAKIKSARQLKPFGVEFCKTMQAEIPTHFILGDLKIQDDLDFELNLISKEFERLKFDRSKWRISDVNKDFKLCATYPQYHIVPTNVTDDTIINMAKFRSKNRFISICYRLIDTDVVMLRSGQPLTGMSGWRSSADEDYFGLISDLTKTNSNNKNEKYWIKIFDARSYTSAQLNRVKGGGMEFEEYYAKSTVEFLNIPNMHTVRSSFDNLSKSLRECDNENFYDLVNKSNWLQLIRQLLKSAMSISEAMYTMKKSVLIHCSDGWDRTPQLTSLSQIIMDPFYRTIEGFKTLIHREWILYGHKFNERCALWPCDYSIEYSPIFLQWLDCVYQLLQQFPDYFYFNETFLIKLALHVYSGLFGTFNQSLSKTNETCSIWSYLSQKEIYSFINPLYSPDTALKIMRPKTQLLNIKLWTKLYFDSLNPNCHEIQHAAKCFGEMPPEVNQISLLNSIIVCKDDMDDYEGEDVNHKPLLLANIYDELIEPLVLMPNSINQSSKIKSYFNTVTLKWSLESLETIQLDDDPTIHFELDLDGLFKQKDFVERFSDTNRRCRRLYKSKIEFYRKQLDYLKNTQYEDKLPKENNNLDIDEIEAMSSSSVDVISDDIETNTTSYVRWVPDHAVTNCFSCKVLFGFINRKHHCRSCGKIFCHKCSNQKSKVPAQKLDYPERVCKKCFIDLNPSSTDLCQSTSRFFPFNFFSSS